MRPALVLALLLTLGACGGERAAGPKGKTTVTTKETPEARASDKGKKWGGWRYRGSRDECFYVVGRKCFATEAAACKAAGCGRGKCAVSGGGPANVKCR